MQYEVLFFSMFCFFFAFFCFLLVVRLSDIRLQCLIVFTFSALLLLSFAFIPTFLSPEIFEKFEHAPHLNGNYYIIDFGAVALSSVFFVSHKKMFPFKCHAFAISFHIFRCILM